MFALIYQVYKEETVTFIFTVNCEGAEHLIYMKIIVENFEEKKYLFLVLIFYSDYYSFSPDILLAYRCVCRVL